MSQFSVNFQKIPEQAVTQEQDDNRHNEKNVFVGVIHFDPNFSTISEFIQIVTAIAV